MTQPPMTPGIQYQPQPQRAGNGMAVASLICGIVACVLFCFGFISVPLGVVAIVLGVIANGKAGRGEATGAGMAKAGLVLGILAVVLSIIFWMTVRAGVSFLGNKAQELQKKLEEEQRRQEEKMKQQQQHPTTESTTMLVHPSGWRATFNPPLREGMWSDLG